MTGSRAVTALVRPVAAPVACAVLLTGLLSGWVADGGGGTLRRLPFTFGLAAVSYLPASPGGKYAATYLVIKNLAGPDELLSARSPVSRRVVLARRGTEFPDAGPPGAGGTLPALTIPARSTTSLSPLGADIVLIDPGELQVDATVPVTLTFLHAGRITVEFTVTPPGTP